MAIEYSIDDILTGASTSQADRNRARFNEAKTRRGRRQQARERAQLERESGEFLSALRNDTPQPDPMGKYPAPGHYGLSEGQWRAINAGGQLRDANLPLGIGDAAGSALQAAGRGRLGLAEGFLGAVDAVDLASTPFDLMTGGAASAPLALAAGMTRSAGRGADTLFLPNPHKARLSNEMLRQQKWNSLEGAERAAGSKRGKIKKGEEIQGPVRPDDKPLGKTPTTGGQYTGAPKGVNTPQKKTAIVDRYVSRINYALDSGVPPGYFYEKGRKVLDEVTPGAAHHRRFAETIGPTSTQVGPWSNLDYAVRAHDQTAMGVPISVGLYPNKLRRSVQAGIYGEDPWTGYKVERYTNLLAPDQSHASHLPTMPPNDQWEWYGVGGNRGHVPTGHTQVAWADHIRGLAARKINDARVADGMRPLTLEELQELHWAAIRHETNLADGIIDEVNRGRYARSGSTDKYDKWLASANRRGTTMTLDDLYKSKAYRKKLDVAMAKNPVQITPKDTMQGSIEGHTFQHSWEAAPGPQSGHNLGEVPVEQYTDEVYGVLSDAQGKDRLISAMGGDLQKKMVRGTGVYKGDTAPGIQSRSLVAHTQSGGIDPASLKRVDITEHLRQFALGQEGRAGHVPQAVVAKSGHDTVSVKTGAIPSEQQIVEVEKVLFDKLNAPIQGDGFVMLQETPHAALVFTDDGYRILNVGGMDNSQFVDMVDSVANKLYKAAGHGEMVGSGRAGIYDEIDWTGGHVTEGLLRAIDDPNYQNVARLADSKKTRRVMGDIADLYDRLQQAGMQPNQKLLNVLRTWGKDGLPGVRKMVQQGLAPAAALGVFSQIDSGQSSQYGQEL